MLSLLAFKRSVFSGVLDGTTDKVLMGDSAMNRFMKTVEAATTATPSTTPSTRILSEADSPPAPGEENGREKEAAPAANLSALRDLVTQGAAWLAHLGEALDASSQRAEDAVSGKAAAPIRIVRDASSGKQELRIAIPDPGAMAKWAAVLRGLLQPPTT